MQDRWCEARNCGEEPSLCAEYRAVRAAFRRFEDFGLLGGVVRVDGCVQAFAIGEALNRDTAVVHFEKAMTEYRGLYQLINQRFCISELDGFRFVNREQDLGIPGLRKAKESYHPHHMVDKYVAKSTAFPGLGTAAGMCAQHGVPEATDL
jgi:hypothetical protein